MTKHTGYGSGIQFLVDQDGGGGVPEVVQSQIVWDHFGLIFCDIAIIDPDHTFEFRSGTVYMHLGTIIPDKDKVVLELFTACAFPIISQLQADFFLLMQELLSSVDYQIWNNTPPGGIGFGLLVNNLSFYNGRGFGEVDSVLRKVNVTP